MNAETSTEHKHEKNGKQPPVPRIGILRNRYSHIPQYDRQIERIAEALAARGAKVEIKDTDSLGIRIENGEPKAPKDWDACIYLDKDEYAASLLERSGVRLFNSAEAIRLCDDKMLTHIALTGSGIRMPDTTPGPLLYDAKMEIARGFADGLERRYGYPMVVKESFGSMGRGVRLVRDRKELDAALEELRGKRFLVQEMIGSGKGEDLRVIVIGGRTVGGILRRSESDFRSNAALGGMATAVDVPRESAEIAEKAAEVLGLDYCGADLLKDEEGRYTVLCEMNSNAFFSAFEEATGIDVAGAYADHVLGIACRRERD